MAERNSLINLAYVLNIFAILTLVVLVGVYFGLSLLPETWQTFRSLAQSLISDISAVLVIFLVIGFFLDRKGLSPSRIFKEDLITDLLKRYPSTKNFLTSQEANAQFDIVEKLKNAKEAYLTGWSLTLLQKISPDIIEAILNGTKIKLLITEPKSSASQLLLQHQTDNDIERDLDLVLKVVSKIKDEVTQKNGVLLEGIFEVRFVCWIPSCSLMFINPNSEHGLMRLMIYPMSVKTNHSAIETFKVIYKKEDPKVFNYFLKDFETFWIKDAISESDLSNKIRLFPSTSNGNKNVETYFRDEIRNAYDFKGLLLNSKTIDIVGYTSKNIIEDCRAEIVKGVLNGCHIRMVVVEPNSDASELIMSNSRLKLFESDIKNTKTRAELIIKDVKDAQEKVQNEIGSFEIRFMNWIPSYTIFLADRELDTGTVKLTINHLAYHTQYKEPAIRKLISKATDKVGFNYASDQFEKVWEISKPLEKVVEN